MSTSTRPNGGGGGDVAIPSNKSNQKLVSDDYLENQVSSRSSQELSSSSSAVAMQRGISTESSGQSCSSITKSQWLTVAVLVYVNLINYMDRFTLAGILDKIQCNFGIENSEGGLLQTVFVISYMIFAPVFGYLGDRYSRRFIMAFGVFLWSLTTLLGSFMDKSWTWFVVCRALVGIGEASYSTIAPTILSDMFTHDMRSKMLALFYFAIPVGSGLGYIVGSETEKFTKDWRWSLRVTPIMGSVATILILIAMIDPPRGQSEGSTALKATSYKEDVVYLRKNKSFILSTLGFTCVTFVAGALAWWGPIFITYGLTIQDGAGHVEMSDVSLKFGVVTMLSGLIGVPLGSYAAQKFRIRNGRADPLICAFGLLASTPLMFLAAVTAQYHTVACFTLIFFAELFLNLNWSIVADILLYTVIPTRRSTAEAFQILLSHAFGDAGSPYLIGIISDELKKVLRQKNETEITMNATSIITNSSLLQTMNFEDMSCNSTHISNESAALEFQSLQYSLFITCFVEVLGGLFFLMTAWYIISDKNKCDRIIATSSGGQLMPDEASSSQTDDDEEDSRPPGRITYP
ncbi:protein spinster isoform X2 [Folsomia candida]|uniref:protein spinster isoform X2 n=1 Tax=Folsomia candida TaxID=158441 RepID=UPI000B908CF7|nr:protein spinster isoform X2 [Folsomia candida]